MEGIAGHVSCTFPEFCGSESRSVIRGEKTDQYADCTVI